MRTTGVRCAPTPAPRAAPKPLPRTKLPCPKSSAPASANGTTLQVLAPTLPHHQAPPVEPSEAPSPRATPPPTQIANTPPRQQVGAEDDAAAVRAPARSPSPTLASPPPKPPRIPRTGLVPVRGQRSGCVGAAPPTKPALAARPGLMSVLGPPTPGPTKPKPTSGPTVPKPTSGPTVPKPISGPTPPKLIPVQPPPTSGSDRHRGNPGRCARGRGRVPDNGSSNHSSVRKRSGEVTPPVHTDCPPPRAAPAPPSLPTRPTSTQIAVAARRGTGETEVRRSGAPVQATVRVEDAACSPQEFEDDCKEVFRCHRAARDLAARDKHVQAASQYQVALRGMDRVLRAHVLNLTAHEPTRQRFFLLQQEVFLLRKEALNGFTDAQTAATAPSTAPVNTPGAPPSYEQVLMEDRQRLQDESAPRLPARQPSMRGPAAAFTRPQPPQGVHRRRPRAADPQDPSPPPACQAPPEQPSPARRQRVQSLNEERPRVEVLVDVMDGDAPHTAPPSLPPQLLTPTRLCTPPRPKSYHPGFPQPLSAAVTYPRPIAPAEVSSCSVPFVAPTETPCAGAPPTRPQPLPRTHSRPAQPPAPRTDSEREVMGSQEEAWRRYAAKAAPAVDQPKSPATGGPGVPQPTPSGPGGDVNASHGHGAASSAPETPPSLNRIDDPFLRMDPFPPLGPGGEGDDPMFAHEPLNDSILEALDCAVTRRQSQRIGTAASGRGTGEWVVRSHSQDNLLDLSTHTFEATLTRLPTAVRSSLILEFDPLTVEASSPQDATATATDRPTGENTASASPTAITTSASPIAITATASPTTITATASPTAITATASQPTAAGFTATITTSTTATAALTDTVSPTATTIASAPPPQHPKEREAYGADDAWTVTPDDVFTPDDDDGHEATTHGTGADGQQRQQPPPQHYPTLNPFTRDPHTPDPFTDSGEPAGKTWKWAEETTTCSDLASYASSISSSTSWACEEEEELPETSIGRSAFYSSCSASSRSVAGAGTTRDLLKIREGVKIFFIHHDGVITSPWNKPVLSVTKVVGGADEGLSVRVGRDLWSCPLTKATLVLHSLTDVYLFNEVAGKPDCRAVGVRVPAAVRKVQHDLLHKLLRHHTRLEEERPQGLTKAIGKGALSAATKMNKMVQDGGGGAGGGGAQPAFVRQNSMRAMKGLSKRLQHLAVKTGTTMEELPAQYQDLQDAAQTLNFSRTAKMIQYI